MGVPVLEYGRPTGRWVMVLVCLVSGERKVNFCALAGWGFIGIGEEGMSRARVVFVVELEASSKSHWDTCQGTLKRI